ncbi:DUF5606 family protein [Namhaeicola litoreus]|uniref:DUF5606 domain-containing protein n=1 Tax=Namhaeicola litoreus TaxID=1052145 RepID=A0ABW3Y3D5_9FLAO
MKIEKIVSIAGKPGLFLVLSQGKNSLIVESLADKKRLPITNLQNISALSDIAIYTYEEEVPLREVFYSIYKKENGAKTNVKITDKEELTSYFSEVLPNFDEERVYPSNIKKVVQWYNLLVDAGFDFESVKEVEEENKEEGES